MTREREQVTVTIAKDVLQDIEAQRRRNVPVPSRSAYVEHLLRKGLDEGKV